MVKSVIACVAIVSIFAGSLGITTKLMTEFSGTFLPSNTSEREISFTPKFSSTLILEISSATSFISFVTLKMNKFSSPVLMILTEIIASSFFDNFFEIS